MRRITNALLTILFKEHTHFKNERERILVH